MNFQSHQAHAKANTAQLLLYLALGTVGLVATLSGAASYWFFANIGNDAGRMAIIMTATITLGFIVLSGIVKSSQVRQGGGSYLAASLGGWPVDFNTHDHAERQLVNVVEEIAIASGMAVPTVFVLRDEPGINAFAAGWNADNAVVGVTRGALHYLSRDELQAVIAHEFSHIANGDTRVKTRIIGWVYGIAALAIMGKVMLRSLARTSGGRSSNSSSGQVGIVIVAVAVALTVAGWIGTWFARRMQAAVNRQREHLADASAVQYTRDPDALANALLKIGALGQNNAVRSAHAQEAGHLFFESPFAKSHATHPPLAQRIRLLMPSWDGSYPTLDAVEDRANHQTSITFPGSLAPTQIPGMSTGTAIDPVIGGAILMGAAGQARPPQQSNPPAPQPSSGFREPVVGAPTDEHIDYARGLLAQIPQATKDYLHTRQGAVAAVLGLLVSPDPAIRSTELGRASELTGFPAKYLAQASTAINSLGRPLQLPAIEIALHSIRETPADVHASLIAAITEFSSSSPDSDLFRWMLRRVVLRHLTDTDNNGHRVEEHTLPALHADASVIYAVIAGGRSHDASSVAGAYAAAHTAAGLSAPQRIPAGVELALGRLDEALDRLAKLDYDGRVSFVEGAIAAVQFDSVITADEAELIRVIADAVRLAMPPLLPAQPVGQRNMAA